MDTAVSCRDPTGHYGDVLALDAPVRLDVPAGAISGILGRNGADAVAAAFPTNVHGLRAPTQTIGASVLFRRQKLQGRTTRCDVLAPPKWGKTQKPDGSL